MSILAPSGVRASPGSVLTVSVTGAVASTVELSYSKVGGHKLKSCEELAKDIAAHDSKIIALERLQTDCEADIINCGIDNLRHFISAKKDEIDGRADAVKEYNRRQPPCPPLL